MTDVITSLLLGNVNFLTGLLLLSLATVLSIVGGAIGGMMLAGKEFGYQFSAMLGAFLGPAGVIPSIIIGLAILKMLFN